MAYEHGPGSAPPAERDDSPGERPLRPEACVYAGERVRTAADLGGGWAALTTHRLLVYDPASADAQYTAVDRPNVVDVDVGTTGGEAWLLRAPQLLFYGIASLIVALTVRAIDFGTAVSVDSDAVPGLGSLLSLFDLLVTGLEVLATGMLVAAFVFLVAGVVAAGIYLHTRQSALVVTRAGDDPVRVPATALAARDAASTLRVHLDVDREQGGARAALSSVVDWPGR